MITVYRENGLVNGKEVELEYRGLSTDEKPTEKVSNGSVFIEIDTGKLYFYDLDNEEWKEV